LSFSLLIGNERATFFLIPVGCPRHESIVQEPQQTKREVLKAINGFKSSGAEGSTWTCEEIAADQTPGGAANLVVFAPAKRDARLVGVTGSARGEDSHFLW
jgi:hypothetical protein